ncbi:Aspartate aminotransferase [Scheffersomyces spartinae]|uniref:Aspartate aminotransferase n=1 Tax=Scheffersomyces spartinae TaxID=45513 RepID=A0A9P8AIG5_9ASCO|nr:Aspartate aminotransferase [Scheffersomyces spartinae]KAG7193710.1 Aspartate aminotransferase [Scheffersomyces spartinae]
MANSYFTEIQELPPDPLFGLKARYSKDTRTDKVDLGIGAYRDNNGKPWVLPAVQQAEAKLAKTPGYNHEYLGIAGYEPFVSSAAKIILNGDNKDVLERTVSVQTLSGTGSLHLAGLFLKKFYKGSNALYLSLPTWANHNQVFASIGFDVKSYPYWDNDTKSLDLNGFLNAIALAPPKSVFLLHACAHNPTGLDPTKEEWSKILEAMSKYDHLPLFDSAYQGFASGSLENDRFAIEAATSASSPIKSSPIIICQSFAKNCGMYGERVGALHIVLPKDLVDLKPAIKSQLNKIIRCEISNPPAYGAKVVALILEDKALYKQWTEDLQVMANRIKSMRVKLRDLLTNKYKTPGNWDHIVDQTGMFSFTGLNKDMVERLERNHGVYLVSSGRASVAGLNDSNVERVAQAIDEVVRFQSKL